MNKNFKKFVWEYLIMNGYACVPSRWSKEEPEWSTYGANYIAADEVIQCGGSAVWREKFLKKLKTIGVDWEKTKEPQGTKNSEFNGTFCDHSDVECLYGTLYLENGEKYLFGCKSNCEFETYAKFFSMLENYNKSGKIFDKES